MDSLFSWAHSISNRTNLSIKKMSRVDPLYISYGELKIIEKFNNKNWQMMINISLNVCCLRSYTHTHKCKSTNLTTNRPNDRKNVCTNGYKAWVQIMIINNEFFGGYRQNFERDKSDFIAYHLEWEGENKMYTRMNDNENHRYKCKHTNTRIRHKQHNKWFHFVDDETAREWKL